jgi:hypothetical protein
MAGDVTFRDSDGGATRAGLSTMRTEMRGLGQARTRAGQPTGLDRSGGDRGTEIERDMVVLNKIQDIV